MGMNAELLAIGKYTPEVRDALDYHSDCYKDTPIGSTIITSVIHCNTTDASEKLARALGISPWAFEQHCDLSGDNADLSLLVESAEDGVLDDVLLLREHGFRFYYLPNG